MVVPEKNLVGVFTGRLSPQEFLIPVDLMKLYIITAVKAEVPLPSNQEGEKLLDTISNQWQDTKPSERMIN